MLSLSRSSGSVSIVGLLLLVFLSDDLGWQGHLILILEQVQRQVLKRRVRPLQVNNAHTLVKNWQYSLHQVFGVGQSLQLLPLALSFDLLADLLVLLFNDASLDTSDLFVSFRLGDLDLLNKIIGLEQGAMRVHSHNVHVNELLVGQLITSRHISHVDVALVLACIIVEENMLCVVVGLVDHEQLRTIRLEARGLVSDKIVLNRHRGVFLEHLKDGLMDIEVISAHLDVVSVNLVDLIVGDALVSR